ncbi:hypothetical protein T484DRAFT_3584901 [Baffinella frigidus]|nr:hypothetical protein T484DRAFT_3584901 [Cryptophyta sp. CCMP2293]
MHAQPLKQAAVPQSPSASWSSSPSPLSKQAAGPKSSETTRGFARPLGMRNPSDGDEPKISREVRLIARQKASTAYVRDATYSSSFNSSNFFAQRQESRGDQLRKQIDPRGHLQEILDRAPLDRNHADGDSVDLVERRGRGSKPAIPSAGSSFFGVSSTRGLGSVEELPPRCSDGSLDADDHGSSLPTLPPSPGPRARRRFSEAARLMIRDAHPALTRSPSEHASLPTPPPSPGPRALRRFSQAARLVIHAQSALTRATSDPAPSSESGIRIMWQPPSNESFKQDFFPEDEAAVSVTRLLPPTPKSRRTRRSTKEIPDLDIVDLSSL